MPLFIDFHNDMQGVSRNAVCDAHLADVDIQDEHGVKYHKFWINEEKGFVFCLIEGPSKEACEKVHRLSHGHVACEIIEVSPSDIALFMGPGKTDKIGQVVHPDGKFDAAVRTFLFTDIVNSTKFTQSFGDTESLKLLRKHNSIVRDQLGKHSGKEVKHTGDGIMAVFSSASKSVRAAMEIQKSLQEYRQSNPQYPLHLKIGINAGEPVTEGNDFFGAAVQLTSRICDLCEPDQILVSEVIPNLCMGKKFPFIKIGDIQPKGFEIPVTLHEIDWLNH